MGPSWISTGMPILTAYVQMKETFLKTSCLSALSAIKSIWLKWVDDQRKGLVTLNFGFPKSLWLRGNPPVCWPHFAQTDNSREQLTAHHVKFLVCYPNYAYLPPSILDLKAPGMKCHHVEHIGNMLPFDCFSEVTPRNLCCFFKTAAFMFIDSWFHVVHMFTTKTKTKRLISNTQLCDLSVATSPSSTHTKIATGRDAGTKGTGKCSDIWLYDQCLCEMQSDGCLKSQRAIGSMWAGIFTYMNGCF